MPPEPPKWLTRHGSLTFRQMLWWCVHPAEDGGLGMAPSEAENLTFGQMIFYLSDARKEEQIVVDDGGNEVRKTAEDKMKEYEEYKDRLRVWAEGAGQEGKTEQPPPQPKPTREQVKAWKEWDRQQKRAK